MLLILSYLHASLKTMYHVQVYVVQYCTDVIFSLFGSSHFIWQTLSFEPCSDFFCLGFKFQLDLGDFHNYLMVQPGPALMEPALVYQLLKNIQTDKTASELHP